MKTPDFYTTREGGQYRLWEFGEITQAALISAPKDWWKTPQKEPYKKLITINEKVVHSLHWLPDGISPNKPDSNGRFAYTFKSFAARWDCLNGWTDGEKLVA